MRPVALSIDNPILASGNTVVLTAADGMQASSFYKEAGHGLFTYFLLLGLRGEADSNNDGWVDIQELYEFTSPNVTKLARNMNREQTPTIFPSTETGGDIIKQKLVRIDNQK
jgi:uncharacterized caspase-like protein